MPRTPKASAGKSAKSSAAKAAQGDAATSKTKVLDPEQITPVLHSTADPENDPEAEATTKASLPSATRDYFKGLPILKAYHGRKLVYYVKIAEGMTCRMFQPNSDEESMFKHILKQPKVAAMVPLSQGEKRGESVQHVQLNGLQMNVIKGRIVHIPANVAQVLLDSQSDTAEAVSSVETVNPFTGETNNANLAYRDEGELRALTR